MNEETRRELSTSVYVAIRTESKSTKRNLTAARPVVGDNATQAMTDRVVESIERSFDVTKKPFDPSRMFSTGSGSVDKPKRQQK